MWIAYNFLSLQGSLQCCRLAFLYFCSCELLTIFYLYKVLCSSNTWWIWTKSVVNCLQFFIFTRFFAVSSEKKAQAKQLWIAYNFLSLQGSLQFNGNNWGKAACCELLTIFYLYKVLCSSKTHFVTFFWVVNCLQFFIFTRFFAVFKLLFNGYIKLWIAYNFLSLQGSLQ